MSPEERGDRRGRERLGDLRAQLNKDREDSAQNRRVIVNDTEPQPLAHTASLPFATILIARGNVPETGDLLQRGDWSRLGIASQGGFEPAEALESRVDVTVGGYAAPLGQVGRHTLCHVEGAPTRRLAAWTQPTTLSDIGDPVL